MNQGSKVRVMSRDQSLILYGTAREYAKNPHGLSFQEVTVDFDDGRVDCFVKYNGRSMWHQWGDPGGPLFTVSEV